MNTDSVLASLRRWSSEATDLHFWFREIDEQANRQARHSQNVDALRAVHVIERFDSLQLHQNCSFDDEIRNVFTNFGALIEHLESNLLID